MMFSLEQYCYILSSFQQYEPLLNLYRLLENILDGPLTFQKFNFQQNHIFSLFFYVFRRHYYYHLLLEYPKVNDLDVIMIYLFLVINYSFIYSSFLFLRLLLLSY